MEKTQKITKISQSIVVSNILDQILSYDLCANDNERHVLEKRFDIPKIKSFRAQVKIYRDTWLHVKGRIETSMIRQSVVSLKEFSTQFDFDFDALFDENPPTDSEEIIDPISNGRINLGEIIMEQFGLNLDFFPHAPDEQGTFEYHEDESSAVHPFEKLKEKFKKN